ncbi:MAG: hypothetical protein IKS98_11495 [Lachnospiraceae bacterium]|nr:hypothetical protein [Lachnospiraceae bacterium]
MRTLRKNKQIIYYATKTIRTAESTPETITVDGKTVNIDEGDYRISYSVPTAILANISFSGGDSLDVEFGLDMSAYDAIIVVNKGNIPITETSLIWYETTPPLAQNNGSTADYSVVAVRHSLNQIRAILKRRVKNNGDQNEA